MGAIVLLCKGAVDVEAKLFAGEEIALGGEVHHSDAELSNVFSTTWSFTTSDSSVRPGKMSDVFVVPNLNVLYDEVYKVFWNDETCAPSLEDNLWPTEFVFNMEVSKVYCFKNSCCDVSFLFNL